MSRLEDCRIIDLQKIEREQGNLSPVYGAESIPFAIAKVFYVYDVPGGAERGGHAHYDFQEFIVAASGAFSVTLDDGVERKSVTLSRSYYGLYVPSLIWRELNDFSTGAVCLTFASLLYDERDYIRNYEDFVKIARARRAGLSE